MDNIILAIETSIKAGSLALLDGANVIDGWTGNNDVSRSEDLIPQIRLLLDKNQIRLNQIEKIAISTGPGSFTGIRVGMAAAKALSLALDCRLIGVSILQAIAGAGDLPETEKKIVAVSAGRDLYFWQSFQGKAALDEPATGDVRALEKILENESDNAEKFTILAERSAYENLSQKGFSLLEKTRPSAGNYAELIGLCAIDSREPENVVPLYIRPAVVTKN